MEFDSSNPDDLPNLDANAQEFLANEAYELMNASRLMTFFILYLFVAILSYAPLLLLPSQINEQHRKLDCTSNSSDVVLRMSYKENKRYHPFVKLLLDYTKKKGRVKVISATYSIDVFDKQTKVQHIEPQNTRFKISPGDSIVLFSLEDISETQINLQGTISHVSGDLADLSFTWIHFNSSFAIFLIMISFILSFILVFTAIFLRSTMRKLNARIPTFSNKFLFIYLIITAVSLIPFSELSFFNILYELHSFSWVFQIIYKTLVFAAIDTMSWNLKYREESQEKLLFYYSFLTLFVFSISHFVSSFILAKQAIKKYLPFIIILLYFINLLRLPFETKSSYVEFRASILHIFIAFPIYCAYIYSSFYQLDIFAPFEIYLKIVSTFTILFITVLHWPFEESMTLGSGNIQTVQDFYEPDPNAVSHIILNDSD